MRSEHAHPPPKSAEFNYAALTLSANNLPPPLWLYFASLTLTSTVAPSYVF